MSKLTRCNECPLRKWWGDDVTNKRTSAKYREVPYKGKKTARIVVVGESPGMTELKLGSPFVGESGELSSSTMRKVGLDPVNVFYANSCRCMLRKDLMGDAEIRKALECCRPELERALQSLEPKIIILYGAVALQQILRERGIKNKRGQLFRSHEFDCYVIPTFHPAFCIRDRRNLPLFEADLRQVSKIVHNNWEPIDPIAASVKEISSVKHVLDSNPKLVAIDTETQGSDWTDPNSIVISYSISANPDEAFNIILMEEVPYETGCTLVTGERKINVMWVDDYEDKIFELRELLGRKDIKKVMMNGNYDLHRLHNLGITEINSYVFDIQLAAHLLNPDTYKQMSLADIQRVFLPDSVNHKDSFKKAFDKSDMLSVLRDHREEFNRYAGLDASVTLAAARVISKQLAKDPYLTRYYKELAHPVATEVFFDIERNGVKFDKSILPKAKRRVKDFLEQTRLSIVEKLPSYLIDRHREKGLRLTRAALISDIVFEWLGLDPVSYTKTGKPSVRRPDLELLREALDPSSTAYEILTGIIEWGPYQKLHSTYLKGFESAIRSDGRLHTQITRTTTGTGRSSSRNPNLQNVPKRNKEIADIIRRMLVAPEGKVLVAVDFSQCELRWIADRSGDETMRGIYRDGGDIHTTTALQLLGVNSPEEVPEDTLKTARRSAKAVNFGFVYGMRPKKFRSYAKSEYGLDLSLEMATKYRDTFFSVYSRLNKWHESEVAYAQKHGFCRTPFGSIRLTPNINSNDFVAKSLDERIAINTPIQAAGNDSTVLAALEAKRCGIVDNDRVKLVLFIHDELVFEVDEDLAEETAIGITELMRGIGGPIDKYFNHKLSIPFDADASIGHNLAEMTELKQ